ncbi:unnamed protein product, partial [Musa acuminata var. zebrina]
DSKILGETLDHHALVEPHPFLRRNPQPQDRRAIATLHVSISRFFADPHARIWTCRSPSPASKVNICPGMTS